MPSNSIVLLLNDRYGYVFCRHTVIVKKLTGAVGRNYEDRNIHSWINSNPDWSNFHC